MNCKQIEDLLPLYASHDLEERIERLVNSHLQSCAACAGAAAEYRDTRQLLQKFAPPPFSEDIYAEMRRKVWRQIETESTTSPFSSLIAIWFRPRLRWAVATALLVAVSAIVILLIGGRSDHNPPTVKRNVGIEQPGQSEPSTAPLPSGVGNKNQRLPDTHQPGQRNDRKVVIGRLNSVAMTASRTPSTLPTASGPNDSIPPANLTNRDSQKTLRMEIQTKNPNIRIIWFAQRDAKQVSINSKGI